VMLDAGMALGLGKATASRLLRTQVEKFFL
jgi:hypothetical protein